MTAIDQRPNTVVRAKKTTSLLAAVGVSLMALTTPAAAEFTPAEKAEIQKMATTLEMARWVIYYSGNALLRSTAASKDAHANLLYQSVLMYDELRVAMNSILAIPSFAGQSQDTLNNDAVYRVAVAKAYLSRGLGKYRNEGVKAALAAVVKAGDQHVETVTYMPRVLAYAEAVYASINLDCCSFEKWKLADWPFLVRRASDGLGVHGDFEIAKAHEARGRRYFTLALANVAEVVKKMPWTPELYGGVRNFTLGFKDTMPRLLEVHLAAFSIGKAESADALTRLLVANEEGLIGGGGGARGMLMFSLRPIVLYMAEHGDRGTGAAKNIAEAVEKVADAWFFAVDSWTWEAIRFPCIQGVASVGCFMQPQQPPTP